MKATTPAQAPQRFGRWLAELRDPPGLRAYPDLQAVAARLQANNPRLTAEKARLTLAEVSTVIVDEIHALLRDKRGSHLALSLERLEHLTEKPFQRIGLSATQKPIETTARFLVGSDPERECKIIDVGHHRTLDLQILTPESELGPVCSHEQWTEVNQQIVRLLEEHRSTLIFVNTRRMAERLTHQLTELVGPDVISSHHGSLAADLRQQTEQRLKKIGRAHV